MMITLRKAKIRGKAIHYKLDSLIIKAKAQIFQAKKAPKVTQDREVLERSIMWGLVVSPESTTAA